MYWQRRIATICMSTHFFHSKWPDLRQLSTIRDPIYFWSQGHKKNASGNKSSSWPLYRKRCVPCCYFDIKTFLSSHTHVGCFSVLSTRHFLRRRQQAADEATDGARRFLVKWKANKGKQDCRFSKSTMKHSRIQHIPSDAWWLDDFLFLSNSHSDEVLDSSSFVVNLETSSNWTEESCSWKLHHRQRAESGNRSNNPIWVHPWHCHFIRLLYTCSSRLVVFQLSKVPKMPSFAATKLCLWNLNRGRSSDA